MIKLGETARQLREARGLTQKEAAIKLGISSVHLCNVEKDKSTPSPELIGKYRELFNADLYVLAWCLHGQTDSLPVGVRQVTERLSEIWRAHLGMASIESTKENVAVHPATKTSSGAAPRLNRRIAIGDGQPRKVSRSSDSPRR